MSKLSRMFHGQSVTDPDWNEHDIPNIKSLIEWKLGYVSKNKEINDYIYRSFDQYCKSKKVATLSLYELYDTPKELVDLILYDYHYGYYGKEDKERESVHKRNIIKKDVFALFTNLRCLEIRTNDRTPFSFIALLSELQTACFPQIYIKTYRDNKKDTSWMLKEWVKSSEKWMTLYGANNLDISIKKKATKDVDGDWEDWIIIQKHK